MKDMYKKLNDIAEIYSGVQISRFIDENADESPVLKNKFIKNNILEYSNEKISEELNEKYYSKKGDIIISLSQPNTVSLIHEDGYIIPMYFAIIRLKKDYNPTFIYHILNSKQFHFKLHKLLEGGALKVIKVNDLKNIKINIPDMENQEKYAEFLNLIDEKTSLLNKKQECNEKIKEYIITQLKGE